MIKTIAFAATLASALAGPASFAGAETLKAIQNEAVDLGATRGSAYYVVAPDGYHLVATLMSGASAPVRFDTVLADGQSATVSVPGPLGTKAQTLTFTRTADHLVVRRAADHVVATQ